MKLVRLFEQVCGGFPGHVYGDVYRRRDWVQMYNHELGIDDDGREPRTTLFYAVIVPRLFGLRGFSVRRVEIKQVHATDCERPYQDCVHDVYTLCRNRQSARTYLLREDNRLSALYPKAPRQPFVRQRCPELPV